MKSFYLTVLALFWMVALCGLSVHDIQYTDSPGGDGFYASPYTGQTVSVSGVVTATNFSGTRYFVSDPEGGPWSGIYVYDSNNAPAVGDMVSFSAAVSEYYGFTELSSVTGYRKLSSGNAVPAPISLTTHTLATAGEPYEGVLVQVEGVSVTSLPSATYNEWYVNDGSGTCQIDDGFFTPDASGIVVGQSWDRIRGVVDFGHNEYAINPRSNADLTQSLTLQETEISTGSLDLAVGTTGSVAVTTSRINAAWNINRVEFTLQCDPAVAVYSNYSVQNTLASGHTVNVQNNGGTVNVSISGGAISGTGALINLVFNGVSVGTTPLTITNYQLNDSDVDNFTNGTITVEVGVPEFTDVSWSPSAPFISNPITVSAHIADPNGTLTGSPRLMYWLSNQAESNATAVNMTSTANSIYQVELPSIKTSSPDNYMLDYIFRMEATDNDNNTAVSDTIRIDVNPGLPVVILSQPQFSSSSLYPADYPFEKSAFTSDSVYVRAMAYDTGGQLAYAKVHYRASNNNTWHVARLSQNGLYWGKWMPPIGELAGEHAPSGLSYIYYVEAVDNDSLKATSALQDIKTTVPAPLIYNLTLLNNPGDGEALQVSVKIVDVSGAASYDCGLNYWKNYRQDNIYAGSLTRDPSDSTGTTYLGSVPALSDGSFATVFVWTENQFGERVLATDNAMGELTYTWPVTSKKAVLHIDPKPFNPRAGEKIEISFNVRENDRIILRIYNAEGKLVRTVKNEIYASSGGSNPYNSRYNWDGRDTDRQLVPPGLYICHLEAVDRVNGGKKTAKAPIVVGRKLD